MLFSLFEVWALQGQLILLHQDTHLSMGPSQQTWLSNLKSKKQVKAFKEEHIMKTWKLKSTRRNSWYHFESCVHTPLHSHSSQLMERLCVTHSTWSLAAFRMNFLSPFDEPEPPSKANDRKQTRAQQLTWNSLCSCHWLSTKDRRHVQNLRSHCGWKKAHLWYEHRAQTRALIASWCLGRYARLLSLDTVDTLFNCKMLLLSKYVFWWQVFGGTCTSGGKHLKMS